MPEVRLGKLLLDNELVTAGQIQDALVKQLSTPEVPLGEILCQMGALRSDDLELFLNGSNKRRKLIENLLKNKLIDESGLNDATTLSQREQLSIEKAMLKLNLLSEEHLARAIASQSDLPYMDISQFKLGQEMARILNANFAQRHKIVPIALDGQSLTIAMAFPLPLNELRHIEKITQCRIIPVIAKERDIVAAMQQFVHIESPTAATNASPFIKISEISSPDTAKSKTIDDVTSGNVDLLVKKLFILGVSKGARDIHFESTEKGMVVRFRIDGMLQMLDIGKEKELINTHRQQIVSKIKSLCDMDIAEHRLPQDGRFSIKAKMADDFRLIDLRVSTIPAQYGESVVIRIFDKSDNVKSLENLGYLPDQVKELIHALSKPAGIFLVTGPNDSGKSSALYALLSKIITPESKTLSVEDPIEYALEGVTQTEVNEIIGNTFAKLLRTFLHQDPNNILVGEIRDTETARIALRAALTGHTVLSTLHTNDSTSVVTRLLDLGIESNIVSSTLRCVLAQRLVRQICRECAAMNIPSLEILEKFGFPSTPRLILMKGKGCDACNHTGYSGRQPIVELWLPTREEIGELNRKSDTIMLRQRVFSSGARATLLEDGFRRVLAGETTLEELLRVIPPDQIETDRNRLKPMLYSQAQ